MRSLEDISTILKANDSRNLRPENPLILPFLLDYIVDTVKKKQETLK